MKKIATLFLSLTLAAGLFAQTAEDALNLSQEFYEGTARSMAMGNAFTALGGDLGAIGINPASSGVFRYSQFTFSPSLTTSRSQVSYLGNGSSARNTGLTVSNLGLVLTYDTGRYNGLLNFNFGVVYNKKNSFRSTMRASGTTDNSSMLSSIAAGLDGIRWESIDLEKTSDPFSSSGASWPGILAWNTYVLAPLSYLGGKYSNVDDAYMASTENYIESSDELRIGGALNQNFKRKSRGSNEEFSFNFGGNYSDYLYFGVNMNLHTVNQTVEEYYEEKAQNSDRFDDGFVSMDNSYWLKTSGAGINFKLGMIVTPFDGLRLGATVTTPTWYSLTDEWDYTMNTAFNNGKSYTEYSPTGSYEYRLTAPMRWSVGAAYTFLDKGLLSVDYEHVNYAQATLSGRYASGDIFSQENNYIRSAYGNAGILRVGAEARLSDWISLRGGYQRYAHANLGGYHVYSAGLGFNLSPTSSIDLAWSRTAAATDTFQLYDDYAGEVTVPVGTNTHSLTKLVCTFAVKF